MQLSGSSPSMVQKHKRSHLDEFLPLYKKFDDVNELKPGSKNRFESPRHKKQAVNISQITIDGTNLNNSGGNCTPRDQSKVTSMSVAKKKPTKLNKKLNSSSTTEQSLTGDNVDLGLSKSKSTKRSKSISFLLEEKEQAVAKKSKSQESHDGAKGDIPLKIKKQKHKKNKKLEKNNDDMSKSEETHSIPDNETEEYNRVKNKKKKKEMSNIEANEGVVKPKKNKKQQELGEYEGQPASKSPKTHIADNLENLNLGDNTHSLTNLIDEMAVVDKEKKKKVRKTENREKNLSKTGSQKENGAPDNEVQAEKKKWVAKRWNKQQIAERDQNTTVHVDNLPVSLLKGNFKKLLIDHFSKYGLSRSVGQPVIQNEEEVNPVFTTKMFFNNAAAATEALEMDGTNIAGNRIRVSPMRPMTETVLVVHVYANPDKMGEKYIRAAFRDVGPIRSIKPMVKKKKTMATIFVEFEGPGAVQKALKKCENLTLNGKKVMASAFSVRTQLKKKRKRGSGSGNTHKNAAVEESGSDDDFSDE